MPRCESHANRKTATAVTMLMPVDEGRIPPGAPVGSGCLDHRGTRVASLGIRPENSPATMPIVQHGGYRRAGVKAAGAFKKWVLAHAGP